MITQLLTITTDAINRLAEQYKQSDNIKVIVTALVDQWQDFEDAIYQMDRDQFLDNAEGTQLDSFGTIVDLGRQGFDDDFYRTLLRVKIGQNVSRGEPFRIINILKLLTGATLVQYQNLGDGKILLAMDTTIPAGQVDLFYANMQRVVLAGVRIDHIVSFDPDESFSFDGTGPIGLGFSSLGAPTTGGQFAFLNRRTTPVFAFDSSAAPQFDPGAEGFGSVLDPIAGGLFQGL